MHGKNFYTLLKNRGGVKYKKPQTIKCISGSTNKSGIRISIDNNYLIWNKLNIKLDRNLNDYYESQAFNTCKIIKTRIVRKYSKTGKYKFYAQIIFDGIKPRNIEAKTGLFKNNIGHGKVGVYVGIKNVTVFDGNKIFQFSFSQGQEMITKNIKLNDKEMDRIRKHLNPDKFDENGKFIGCENIKSEWILSNNYIRIRNKNKYLYSKRKNKIKHIHEQIANSIIQLGNYFVINELDGRANAKFRKKLINEYSPSSFLKILKRKIFEQDGKVIEVGRTKFDYSKYEYFSNKLKISSDFNSLITFKDIQINYKLYYSFLFYLYEDDEVKRANEATLENFINSAKHIMEIDVTHHN